MSLITTTTIAIITPFLIELAKKGTEKAIETVSKNLTEGSLNWLKSLFFKEDKPKKALKELIENPKNSKKQNAIKILLESSLEDNSENEKYLVELLQKLPKIGNTITHSKNINTGNVNTNGGDFRIGDNYGHE